MPFQFGLLCKLLEELESLELHDPPLLPARKTKDVADTITRWFRSNHLRIHRSDTDAVALLSCLFPERRTDRVYGMQETTLVRVICRSLGFGLERLQQLKSWKKSSHEDLPMLIERLQKVYDAGMRDDTVTIEHVDTALAKLAARCRFSSPEVQLKFANNDKILASDILTPLVGILPSQQLKWFVRIVLKRLGYVSLDEQLVFRCYHFLLPDILRIHSTFDAAIKLLSIPLVAALPTHSGPTEEKAFKTLVAPHIRPQVGIKVGRPEFLKARSIQHCLEMVGKGVWSLEPKYDGEYCQIHIDLSRGDKSIQIFSKSGKDSTQDRANLHEAIRKSLSIGEEQCKLKRQCILEGELVVWSDKENRIVDFHKIRKYVRRSGTCIGIEQDSPTHSYEHLMIVYYDALLIDDENVMAKPYEERRRCLRRIITKYPRLAITAEWVALEISNHKEETIKKYLSTAIAARAEGLVLKPCHGPYLSLTAPTSDWLEGCFIKLKKDYIPGLGDTADFAIIGAKFDISEAQKIGTRNIRWTSFVIACLENKEEAVRYQARPLFRAMGVVGAMSHCLSKENTVELCNHGSFIAEDFQLDSTPSTFDLHPDGVDTRFDVVFKKPFIVEVLGSSFEKPATRGYWMLRHPRVIKMHSDRALNDVVTFEQLQEMAAAAKSTPADLHKEQELWRQKLGTTPEQPTSPYATRSSESTPSPRKEMSVPMVRVDTCEMMPGDARFAPALSSNTADRELPPEILTSDIPPSPPQSSGNAIAASLQMRDPSAGQSSANKGTRKRKNGDEKAHDTPRHTHKRVAHEFPPTPQKTPSKPARYQSPAISEYSIQAATSPLRGSVVYLPPSLAGYLYLSQCICRNRIFEDQSTTFITDLRYWIRELDRTLTKFDPVVQESQAYPHTQKVVLLESRHHIDALQSTDEVLSEVVLAVGEDIEIWDWRVLCSIIANTQSTNSEAVEDNDIKPIDSCFLGSISFSEREGRNVFTKSGTKRMVDLQQEPEGQLSLTYG